MEKRSMSSVLADSRNSLAGARAGARLGSTNTLNMGQVLHCNLGFRIEQLKNLDVEPNTQIKVRIKIGDQVNPWVSGVAEIGFEKRNYGWPDDIAEIIFNDLPIISGTFATVELVGSVGDEPDRVITLKPVTMDLFQNLEDKSIVVNEGLFTPTAQIINTEAPCEFSIRIFSDARVPAPFLFDSKRLDKPLPAGAWYKVDRDPSMQCTNVLEGGGLSSFKFSIDGARFLPENCTICRIQCQLMHRDQSLFDATQEPIDLIPDLDSPTYFPTYTNSVTIKLPSLASAIDATLTIVMKIFTIDRHTRQLLTVGIALFNVFLADVEDSIDGSRVQPSSPTTRPIFLNEGYHQIPVYMWTTRMGFKDAGVHVNAVKSQRVPCCSILMRLSGRDDLPPKLYQDRVYNSMQCIPLPYEMGLFYFLMKERGLQPPIRTALQQLKEQVRAANDDALIGWMGRRVSKEKGIIPSMELSCILKYHEGRSRSLL
ncbi:hypothetical protein BCR33DRAFT_469919 [Rhizoclosmatium globosum]|uniref:Uncharacterized protein n=1 Tax=Rhizoclosmatium globosum TaxID=329046 RepID=A0A1Y2BQR0_9FUNG|nr:hypothetical protein BCR33DRAFT_469919 [Rhizoclosmatium globosum]|eukprot:ORY37089.1 hypothetical protein BCR33DRAFT_469919 [Rhizoclosmatium globosum]